MNGWIPPVEKLRDWTAKQRLESVLETLADCPAYAERDEARSAVMAAIEACQMLYTRMEDSILSRRIEMASEGSDNSVSGQWREHGYH